MLVSGAKEMQVDVQLLRGNNVYTYIQAHSISLSIRILNKNKKNYEG
jgi:hypothetical protein